MITILKKLGSPKWFYHFSHKLTPWIAFFSITVLFTGMIWGLLFAPEDYLQGQSFRIFYVHVPTAFLAQSIYIAMAIFSFISLVWRIKLTEMLSKSCATIGISYTFIALVTGSLWGAPTWGTWWIWDARLTSMLLLFFLYLGVIALHSNFENRQTAAKAAGILAIIGVVNIPIIKLSVNWWNTLHQPATLKFTQASSITVDMLIPFLICFTGFSLFAAWMIILKTQNEILIRESKTKWLKEAIKNHAI